MIKRILTVALLWILVATPVAYCNDLTQQDLPEECIESNYCAFITNLETGKVKVIQSDNLHSSNDTTI